MRERPILFSGPMVRAILDGRKWQTRRVMKPQPAPFAGGVHETNLAKHPAPYIDAYCGEPKTAENPRGMGDLWCWWTEDDRQGPSVGRCPYGAPGDRLWVRETWGCPSADHPRVPDGRKPTPGDGLVYAANDADAWQWRGGPGCSDFVWRPSIHMPRWASRLTLPVTAVRVERLQDVTDDDAIAEGTEFSRDPVRAFSALWDSINGKRPFSAWDDNPWVWVVSFTTATSTAT